MNVYKKLIYEDISKNKGTCMYQIAKRTNISISCLRYNLKALESNGYITIDIPNGYLGDQTKIIKITKKVLK